MKTQLKEMLEGCRIEAKWLNCGTWTKEIFTNLLEFCEMRSLKITKKGNSYNLKLKIGNYTLQKKQIDFCNLERSIYEFVYIYMFTLGGKSKLKTRFKNHSIFV
jgi:hypothetical protein